MIVIIEERDKEIKMLSYHKTIVSYKIISLNMKLKKKCHLEEGWGVRGVWIFFWNFFWRFFFFIFIKSTLPNILEDLFVCLFVLIIFFFFLDGVRGNNFLKVLWEYKEFRKFLGGYEKKWKPSKRRVNTDKMKS